MDLRHQLQFLLIRAITPLLYTRTTIFSTSLHQKIRIRLRRCHKNDILKTKGGLIMWTTIYSGDSPKVQHQIASILHQSGIPYRVSAAGVLLTSEKVCYRVRVQRADVALAVLLLKKHRRQPPSDAVTSPEEGV